MTQNQSITHAKKGKARPDSHKYFEKVNIIIGISYYQERSMY